MASKNAVTLTFAGDDKSLVKAFDKVGAAAKDMSSDLDSAASRGRSFGGAIDKAGGKVGAAESKFQGTADLLDGMVTTLGIPGAGAVPFVRGMADVAGGLDQLAPVVSGVAGKLKNLSITMVQDGLKATVAVVTQTGRQIAAWAATALAATINAGKIAAAWLISIGPIALVVAAVAGAVLLVVKYWDQIKAAASAVWNWVKDRFNNLKDFFIAWAPLLLGPVGLVIKYWDSLKTAATAVKTWVVDRFNEVVTFLRDIPGRIGRVLTGAWDGIKDGATTAKNWISDRFDDIVNLGKNLGGRIAAAVKGAFGGIVGAFKTAWNAVAGFINGLTDFKIDIPFAPDIHVNFPDIPTFHQGGVVPGRPGQETLGLLQAGERVIPAGGGGGGNTYYLTVNALDSQAAGTAVIRAIDEWEARNGRRYTRA